MKLTGASLLLAFRVDIRARKSGQDYAFWLYLFGVMAFWSGAAAGRPAGTAC